MAPTGTGKTLTPIALSEKYKIIFVCAARHVGLALARAAISINKKIAFAFGCASATDIRLHFFAAKEYVKHKKSGGIFKVDNSNGSLVEIIICDIKSFLPAMYYMKSFNTSEELIVYWDEPTITMDYETHDFHNIIRKNWKNNLVPNIVLSSATLPKSHEITETISDFITRFDDGQIYNIVSHDCKKSIPILNKNGMVVLPHYLGNDYNDILHIANHCEEYLTLTRYFDLNDVVKFISYILKHNLVNNKMDLDRHFSSLDDINMKNIKIYYIKLLQNITNGPEKWNEIYEYFKNSQISKIPHNLSIDAKGNKVTNQLLQIPNENTLPGSYITTKDAFTLTDGPTIFITDNIEKISKFCVQQANIPSIVMDDIMKKIEFNNILNDKIDIIEKELELKNEQMEKNQSSANSGSNKDIKNTKKMNRDVSDKDGNSKNILTKLSAEISSLKSMIKNTNLNETFIPNKKHHISKWANNVNVKNAFTSNIDEHIVSQIMLLHGVDDSWKILLMMGIGVMTVHDNIAYTEIMKKLADEQKLYMIIATSDYIYGTNYQLCHGYLGSDLNLTQEKIIQSIGRIGRNNIQQEYSLRFRNNSQILKLFTSNTDKPEIINMNTLFNSSCVKWNGTEYLPRDEYLNDE